VVELDDTEFTAIKDFITKDLGDAVDWGTAPEELKNAYANVIQILNAYGQEGDQQQQASQDMGMMAPA
jgi:hypothetical protein